MTDHVKAAMAAVTLMATHRDAMDAAKAEGGSARQAFAKSALLATAAMGRAGLDAVKAAFDKLDKGIRDKAKGAVSETLGIIRYVVDGNTLPETDKTPAIGAFGDLLATDVALSGFVKVWRETKGRESGNATAAEAHEATVLSAGIVALGIPGNAIDAASAHAKANGYTVTLPNGTKVTTSYDDIVAAGEAALEAEARKAEAEAAAAEREAFRAKVVEYLATCTPDELAAVMAESALPVRKAA